MTTSDPKCLHQNMYHANGHRWSKMSLLQHVLCKQWPPMIQYVSTKICNTHMTTADAKYLHQNTYHANDHRWSKMCTMQAVATNDPECLHQNLSHASSYRWYKVSTQKICTVQMTTDDPKHLHPNLYRITDWPPLIPNIYVRATGHY